MMGKPFKPHWPRIIGFTVAVGITAVFWVTVAAILLVVL